MRVGVQGRVEGGVVLGILLGFFGPRWRNAHKYRLQGYNRVMGAPECVVCRELSGRELGRFERLMEAPAQIRFLAARGVMVSRSQLLRHRTGCGRHVNLTGVRMEPSQLLLQWRQMSERNRSIVELIARCRLVTTWQVADLLYDAEASVTRDRRARADLTRLEREGWIVGEHVPGWGNMWTRGRAMHVKWPEWFDGQTMNREHYAQSGQEIRSYNIGHDGQMPALLARLRLQLLDWTGEAHMDDGVHAGSHAERLMQRAAQRLELIDQGLIDDDGWTSLDGASTPADENEGRRRKRRPASTSLTAEFEGGIHGSQGQADGQLTAGASGMEGATQDVPAQDAPAQQAHAAGAHAASGLPVDAGDEGAHGGSSGAGVGSAAGSDQGGEDLDGGSVSGSLTVDKDETDALVKALIESDDDEHASSYGGRRRARVHSAHDPAQSGDPSPHKAGPSTSADLHARAASVAHTTTKSPSHAASPAGSGPQNQRSHPDNSQADVEASRDTDACKEGATPRVKRSVRGRWIIPAASPAQPATVAAMRWAEHWRWGLSLPNFHALRGLAMSYLDPQRMSVRLLIPDAIICLRLFSKRPRELGRIDTKHSNLAELTGRIHDTTGRVEQHLRDAPPAPLLIPEAGALVPLIFEYDNGTKKPGSVAAQLIAYEYLAQQGSFAERWTDFSEGYQPPVFMVFSDEQRMHQTLRRARSIINSRERSRTQLLRAKDKRCAIYVTHAEAFSNRLFTQPIFTSLWDEQAEPQLFVDALLRSQREYLRQPLPADHLLVHNRRAATLASQGASLVRGASR